MSPIRRSSLAFALALSAGCAGPGPVVFEPPVPEATPAVPMPTPWVPSQNAGAPCEAGSAPYGMAMAGLNWPTPLLGRSWVVLRRCDDLYLQRVGEPPEPLALATADLELLWLASDGNTAIGVKSSSEGAVELVKRTAGGGPDITLYTGTHRSFSVSPDGDMVAFGTFPDEGASTMEVTMLRTSGTEPRGLAKVEGTTMTRWWWSPDGERLAFVMRQASETFDRLAWTSWDSPGVHLIEHTPLAAFSTMYDQLTWASDSRHLLVIDQNPKLPGYQASVIKVDLGGKPVSRSPLVDQFNQAVTHFVPRDVRPGEQLVVGDNGLLDPETGIVRTLPNGAGIIGWSDRPGRLLRWQTPTTGPRLDRVALDDVTGW